MRAKAMIKWMIVPVVLVVVLATSGTTFGESGCHRGGNTGGTGTSPVSDRP